MDDVLALSLITNGDDWCVKHYKNWFPEHTEYREQKIVQNNINNIILNKLLCQWNLLKHFEKCYSYW